MKDIVVDRLRGFGMDSRRFVSPDLPEFLCGLIRIMLSISPAAALTPNALQLVPAILAVNDAAKIHSPLFYSFSCLIFDLCRKLVYEEAEPQTREKHSEY